MNYLCCYFPLLPLQVFNGGTRPHGEELKTPFAIQHHHNNRPQVLQCNEAAAHYGIQEGMSITTAQSLTDLLIIKPRNPPLEKKTLLQLAIWANQFSPKVSNQHDHALILEIGSCLKLFKGLATFLKLFNLQRDQLPYQSHIALAETPAAAYLFALSTFHQGQAGDLLSGNALLNDSFSNTLLANSLTTADINAPKQQSIPIHYLDCKPDIIERLNGMGISTLGALLALPQAELSRRFGISFTQYLQRLTGTLADPQSIIEIPDKFSAETHFMEEIYSVEGLLFPIQPLLQELSHYLRLKQLTVRGFALELMFREIEPLTLNVGFSASKNGQLDFVTKAAHLIRLHFATLQLTEAVIAVKLDAAHFSPLQQNTQDLFNHHLLQSICKAELLDQLSARLGQQGLQGINLADDHRPERAWGYCSPSSSTSLSQLQSQSQSQLQLQPQSQSQLQPQPPKRSKQKTSPKSKPGHFPLTHQKARPLWLLPQPQALNTQQGRPYYAGLLTLIQGPERIESGWWDQHPVIRDYYIAHHPCGHLYWLFKHLKEQRWYLHGLFA